MISNYQLVINDSAEPLETMKSKAADKAIVAAVAGCQVEADSSDGRPRA